MLNPNAQKWVAALRSGRYKQGKGKLKAGSKYCCLGVACKLYPGKLPALRDFARLPDEVQEWLGLNSDSGEFGEQCLAKINDEGASFAEIADLIESEPEGLFMEVVQK